MDPEVTVHPYENGMQRRGTNGRHIYKQFSSVLIVRLEVDKPWKEVGGRIKTGGAINLLGFGSQSSAEDSPQKKRSWGGGGGRRGGSKRSKLNSVEEDEEEEEDDDAGDKEYWSYYIFMSYKIATYIISHNSLNLSITPPEGPGEAARNFFFLSFSVHGRPLFLVIVARATGWRWYRIYIRRGESRKKK
jgi:hypothetical protein